MKRLLTLLVLIAALAVGCTTTAPKATDTPAAQQQAMVTISVEALHKRMQDGERPLIIDVREQSEWDEGHIESAQLMPLGSAERLIDEAQIPKDQEVILICRSGNRSAQAYRALADLGYTNLKNVTGGMNAWAKVGPVVK